MCVIENIGIYFVPNKEWAITLKNASPWLTESQFRSIEPRLSPNAAGYFVRQVAANNTQVSYGNILVSTDYAEIFKRRAITEEVVSVLGFPDSANQLDYNSIFLWAGSNGKDIQQLTDIDKFMVWAHYSPAIKPGMTKDIARSSLTSYLSGN